MLFMEFLEIFFFFGSVLVYNLFPCFAFSIIIIIIIYLLFIVYCLLFIVTIQGTFLLSWDMRISIYKHRVQHHTLILVLLLLTFSKSSAFTTLPVHSPNPTLSPVSNTPHPVNSTSSPSCSHLRLFPFPI